ncbi:hypothetical protein AVI51_04290 [Piscirickettsia salmonis]|uniref:Uncharacterized protein n=1 Tax=Piscirickettsia salmonis TaxID=1238 RepID=A0A9Q5VFK8_PISSA|nr:hypothetical protein [Piscirickettsia salmonis]ALA25327.1 integrase [Piscirickettsia salmonis]APS45562.1 hypothetical protein AVI48_15045 [Piscirickettsia salmonis]APS46218.1 hypothetical protein AVI49_00265 [Piscirickettsia salmonis]APS50150.1 hypothetical protein AVI50_04330 [Piscirickettsia salmonis]APS53350.1 hypothetical protein AVI51_04290 [Piscirickettsia salmonis]
MPEFLHQQFKTVLDFAKLRRFAKLQRGVNASFININIDDHESYFTWGIEGCKKFFKHITDFFTSDHSDERQLHLGKISDDRLRTFLQDENRHKNTFLKLQDWLGHGTHTIKHYIAKTLLIGAGSLAVNKGVSIAAGGIKGWVLGALAGAAAGSIIGKAYDAADPLETLVEKMEHFIATDVQEKFSHHHIQLAWNNLIASLESDPSPERLEKIELLAAMNDLPKPLLESWERIVTQLVVQLMLGHQLTDVALTKFLYNTLSKGIATLQAVKADDPSIDPIYAQRCFLKTVANILADLCVNKDFSLSSWNTHAIAAIITHIQSSEQIYSTGDPAIESGHYAKLNQLIQLLQAIKDKSADIVIPSEEALLKAVGHLEYPLVGGEAGQALAGKYQQLQELIQSLTKTRVKQLKDKSIDAYFKDRSKETEAFLVGKSLLGMLPIDPAMLYRDVISSYKKHCANLVRRLTVHDMINHIMTAADVAGPLAENPYSPLPTPQPEHTIVSGALVGSIFLAEPHYIKIIGTQQRFRGWHYLDNVEDKEKIKVAYFETVEISPLESTNARNAVYQGLYRGQLASFFIEKYAISDEVAISGHQIKEALGVKNLQKSIELTKRTFEILAKDKKAHVALLEYANLVMSQLAEINQALGNNSQISEHFIAIQQEQIASLQTYIKETQIKESREQRTPEYMIYDSKTLDKVADYFSINNPRQKDIIKNYDTDYSFIHLQALLQIKLDSSLLFTMTDIVSQLEELVIYSKKIAEILPEDWQFCSKLTVIKNAIAQFIKERHELIARQLQDGDTVIAKSELELLTNLLVNKDFETLVRSVDAGNNIFPGMLNTRATVGDAGIIRAVLTTAVPATDWKKSWFSTADWTLEDYLKQRAIDYHPDMAKEVLSKLVSPEASPKRLQDLLAHGKNNSRGASLGKALDECFVFYGEPSNAAQSQRQSRVGLG